MENHRVERERRILSHLALQLVDAETPRALAVAICEACRQLFEHDSFHFSERAPDTDLFRRVYAEDLIDDVRVILPDIVPPNLYRTMPELHQGQALLINRPASQAATPRDAPSPADGRADKETASGPLQRFGDQSRSSASLLFAPVTIGGQLFGIVSVQSYTPRRYDGSQLTLLKSLGHLVAPALRRIQAEEALRLSEQRYRHAIEQADAVPYQKDYETGRLLYMSEGIQRLTGYSPEQLTSEVWRSMVQEIVLHGDLSGLPTGEALHRVKVGELSTYRADYRIRTRDGRERWLGDSSINLTDAQGKPYGSLGILQDNTERMRTLALNRALSRLGRRLSGAVTPREVARVVVDTADELIGWDSCYVDLYSAEEDSAHSILTIDLDNGERREFPSVYAGPHKPGPIMARAMKEGPQLILREDIKPGDDPPLLLFGNTSLLALSIITAPIREQGKTAVGVLSIQSHRKNAYARDDVDILEVLADHCAGALERTLAEEKLRRSEQRVAAFAALAHRLNAVTTPKEAGEIIAETADQLVGWDAFIIDLYNPEDNVPIGVLNLDTVDGRKVEFEPLTPEEGLSAMQRRVLREGACLIHRHPKEEAQRSQQKDTISFGDRSRRSLSLLYAPARKGRRVVGLLSIQSYRPYAYTEADIETFQALADHCAGALERLRIEKTLEEERNLLRTLIDNLPDLIYVKDREGRFVVNNQAHYNFMGATSQDEVAGKTDFDYFSRDQAQQHFLDEQEMIRTGRTVLHREQRLAGKKGKPMWTSATKVLLRDAQGRPTGLVGISRDITESKRAREALARQARELARSNAELENFAYIASHDLQEPLRKILAFGDRLKARTTRVLDEQGLDFLDRMQTAAQRMKNLINDLLAFSRVTTQGRPFERVDLAAVVHEVVSDLEVRIEQARGRVEVGALPTIEADPVQMRQLFQNLIGNSLKFHKPNEPPIVGVDAAAEAPEEPAAASSPTPLCRVSVQDNGIGFDEKYLDRIFAPFQRLHGRGEYEGTGIGLAVCRKIVERHGGSLTAHSAPGKGSTFIVALPAQHPKEAPSHD